MNSCLIYNGTAGSAAAITRLIHRFGGPSRIELCPTQRPGDARRLAGDAVRRQVPRIIAAGGDGTISEVINGIAPQFEQVEVAILPLGTGNDLARSLAIPTEDLEAALDLALTGEATFIDLVRMIDGREEYLVNAANGGFGGHVAARIDAAAKQQWGAFAYWLTAAANLADLHEYAVQVTIDDAEFHWRVYGLAVANGRYVGGGFPIANDAWLNDGQLHLTVIPVLPPLELLAAGLNFMLGLQHDGDGVIVLGGQRIRLHSEPEMLFSIDGEPTRRIDATFETAPNLLQIVAGAGAQAIRRT